MSDDKMVPSRDETTTRAFDARRRAFLQGIAAGAATLALGACNNSTSESEQSASAGDNPSQPAPSPAPVPGTTVHSVTLAWDGPTRNADSAGSVLTDLAGYRVYMSSASGSYANGAVRQISATVPGATERAIITGLAAGTYYFVVTAFDMSGNESARAGELRVVVS